MRALQAPLWSIASATPHLSKHMPDCMWVQWAGQPQTTGGGGGHGGVAALPRLLLPGEGGRSGPVLHQRGRRERLRPAGGAQLPRPGGERWLDDAAPLTLAKPIYHLRFEPYIMRLWPRLSNSNGGLNANQMQQNWMPQRSPRQA